MSNADVVEQINKALFAHGAWKMRLRAAIGKGDSDLTVDIVKRDDCCAFGKWLHGSDVESEVRASMPHQVATRLHKEFHLCAAKVLEEAIHDNRDSAVALLKGEFADRSQILMIALTRWKRELNKQKAA